MFVELLNYFQASPKSDMSPIVIMIIWLVTATNSRCIVSYRASNIPIPHHATTPSIYPPTDYLPNPTHPCFILFHSTRETRCIVLGVVPIVVEAHKEYMTNMINLKRLRATCKSRNVHPLTWLHIHRTYQYQHIWDKQENFCFHIVTKHLSLDKLDLSIRMYTHTEVPKGWNREILIKILRVEPCSKLVIKRNETHALRYINGKIMMFNVIVWAPWWPYNSNTFYTSTLGHYYSL